MNLLVRALRFFLRCQHPHMYRERRPLYGAEVLHLVCPDCGHAVPALQRPAEEQVEAVRAGAVTPPAARRLPADVVDIGVRRAAANPERRERPRRSKLPPSA